MPMTLAGVLRDGATSVVQEFTDSFIARDGLLTHEQWAKDVQGNLGIYMDIFGWTEQEANMLKSMKSGLTQVTKDEKQWTYAGIVKIPDAPDPEPLFLFSTNPRNVHPFCARDVLECLKTEAAGGEGVKFMREHPLGDFGS